MAISNFTGTGAFQEVAVPRGSTAMRIQARGAVDIQLKYKNSADYFTLKSGSALDMTGQLSNLQINAANGEVVELFFSTSAFGGF